MTFDPLSGRASDDHVADPPIQVSVALRRIDGDLDLLEELVKTFLEDLPEHVQRLKAAIDRGDSEETARSAHSLRGSLGILAAQQAQSLATELETLAAEGRLDEAAELYRTFESELERVSAFVSSPDWQSRRWGRFEVCEKVRAATLPMPPYLILLTSRGETDDVVKALQAGADDHIAKPFEELRARVSVGVRIVTLQQQLTDRVRALEEALAHVQQLQGLIPICAWCRQVRNDGNFWEQVESYLEKRSGLQFSHAICPPCKAKEMAKFKVPSGAH